VCLPPVGPASRLKLGAIVSSASRLDLTPEARARLARSLAFVLNETSKSKRERIYGVTTGTEMLGTVERSDPGQTQIDYVTNYAIGQGAPLPDPIVKLAVLLRANTFAKGLSGVREELIDQFLALYNAGYVAVVPSEGSVGASGDMMPLAHLALAFIGQGTVRHLPTGDFVPAAHEL
jgi:histidine ammonia-lyase